MGNVHKLSIGGKECQLEEVVEGMVTSYRCRWGGSVYVMNFDTEVQEFRFDAGADVPADLKGEEDNISRLIQNHDM